MQLKIYGFVQSVVSLKNSSVGLSCDFPLGAGFLLHLERETAHDRPTNIHFECTLYYEDTFLKMVSCLKVLMEIIPEVKIDAMKPYFANFFRFRPPSARKIVKNLTFN